MNRLVIKKVRQELSKHRLDALLITSRANVAYLSGFQGEGHLIITQNKEILAVDFRFKEQARKEISYFQIWDYRNFCPLEVNLGLLTKKLRLNNLGFEASWLSYGFYRKLKNTLKSTKLIPTAKIIENLRAIKNVHEIKLLKKAASVGIKSYIFAQKIIKPEKKETEIARELQYFMRKHGAEDCSFDIIVASGKRSSMPHAPASGRKIKDNDIVLIDLGCRVSGYNSDLTRMIFLGKINAKIRRVHSIVKRAQKQAIEAIKAGVEIRQIDKIARQYITKAGLGIFFGHALGHGIGREVHEYPSISPHNLDYLKEGMVFTVEPGIYLPGWGGIRVEDMVLVTQSGYEVLTKND